jgi:hypothetical protein
MQPSEPVAGWTGACGPLPHTILPAPPTDPVIRGWLELICSGQDCASVRAEHIVRRLQALADELREARSEIAALQRQIREGFAAAAPAGQQGAEQTYTYVATCDGQGWASAVPCTVCSAAGGTGCESATCRGPA